ncbi:HAD hydrolase-like protein [Entomospira culicis]|uniref:HAD hydrolase-like protein n=1 Tax=Entomospira culicis TaxID=2719989 RepID=A0A968GJ87_9SPIO|nr:HAD hydrolase-like protein [Entomospira culicis]NIZ19838.1 HAD hydrolase-like protein [Entomospira culicis]NIZ70052.1 HAD hydrolase-like protein [Entomospira culicis]WDI37157.1 HAD hydrolase-like protein [Entomospira culicis]WDI38786.1 HAD hydrolase-like protein [Entomospira culicis]
MSKFDLIIYDFDGTLYDTRPGLHKILRQMLAEFGFNPDGYDLKEFVGPPMEWSLANIVGAAPDVVTQMIVYFRPRYQESALEHLIFFDGIMPMLEEFKQAGKKQAIASLKFRPSLDKILEVASIGHLFDAVAGYYPDAPETKAQLMRTVIEATGAKAPIMVGDRHFDLTGAQEVGVPFIGVGYGYARDMAELAEGDYWVATVAELHQFLAQHT